MPILVMGIVALLIFLAMGFMLFSAMTAERRDRRKRTEAAPASQETERAKSQAAHA